MDCTNGNDSSQNFEILAGYDSGKAAVSSPSQLLKTRSASSVSFIHSAGYLSSTSEDCDARIEPSAEDRNVQEKKGENQTSPILESQLKDELSSESSDSEAEEAEIGAGQTVDTSMVERPPSDEDAEDALESAAVEENGDSADSNGGGKSSASSYSYGIVSGGMCVGKPISRTGFAEVSPGGELRKRQPGRPKGAKDSQPRTRRRKTEAICVTASARLTVHQAQKPFNEIQSLPSIGTPSFDACRFGMRAADQPLNQILPLPAHLAFLSSDSRVRHQELGVPTREEFFKSVQTSSVLDITRNVCRDIETHEVHAGEWDQSGMGVSDNGEGG